MPRADSNVRTGIAAWAMFAGLTVSGNANADPTDDVLSFEDPRSWQPIGVTELAFDGKPSHGARSLRVLARGFAPFDGFLVNGPRGRGAVTAGHCFLGASVGSEVLNGAGDLYGQQGSLFSSGWDLALIDPAGEQFSALGTFHTGPSAPVTRKAVGHAAPAKGQVLCISGAPDGAKCGLEVESSAGVIRDMSFRGFNYKANNVFLARHPDKTKRVSQHGTSGAPLYQPRGTTEAVIIGMHIGAPNIADPARPGFTMVDPTASFFHSAADVLTRLGVTLVRP